jgi:hypothetical protein
VGPCDNGVEVDAIKVIDRHLLRPTDIDVEVDAIKVIDRHLLRSTDIDVEVDAIKVIHRHLPTYLYLQRDPVKPTSDRFYIPT